MQASQSEQDCGACPAHTFSLEGEHVCTQCPDNAQGPSASGDRNNCQCNAGYTGADGGTCIECVAGKYKTEKGDAVCTSCRPGQYSSIVGAASNVCLDCTANSHLLKSSDEPTDCICQPGSSGLDGGICTLCAADTYNPVEGAATCLICPAESVSAVGSITVQDCMCDIGWTGWSFPVNVARACGVEYQNNCPVDISSPWDIGPDLWGNPRYGNDGVTSDSALIVHSSVSRPNSIQWYTIDFTTPRSVECMVFYNRVDSGSGMDNATLRIAGATIRVGDNTSSEHNPMCAALSTDTVQNSVCAATGRFMSIVMPNTLALNFLELEAYTSQCQKCATGTFKNGTGPNQCTFCSPHATSLPGSISAAACTCVSDYYGPVYNPNVLLVCTACPVHSVSEPGSIIVSDCKCTAGYQRVEGVCVPCETGKFKTTSGDFMCTSCAEGKSSIETAAVLDVCLDCNPHSSSPAASGNVTACRCFVGFTGPDGGLCTICPTGTFKTNEGSAFCTLCTAGKYSTETGSPLNVCQNCLANSHSSEASDDINDCKCDAGYVGPDGGVCETCIAGKFKTVAGNTPCSSCDQGKYSTLIAATFDVCETCPVNSSAPRASDKLTKCACDPGFTGPSGGLCQLCVAGTFKVDPGNALCTNCLANQYSSVTGAISNPCQPCQSNSASLPVSDAREDCICNAGSSGPNGGSCALCGVGKYKIEPGEAVCSMCASGTYSTSVGAVGNDVCSSCPDRSNSPEGSDENIDCTCNRGATGMNGGTCTMCVAGKF